jgi:acyl-CoA reductase-like NAD-dependent aldehyde dehydrogenase
LVYPTIIADANHGMLGIQEETFGPVSFVMSFDSVEEAIRLAKDSRYGLRATVYGEEEAERVAEALCGEPYCHPVEDFLLGKFGTVSVNEPRSESWKGALVTKPIGGYGHSGWVWETVGDKFLLKQGPKLLSIETSIGQPYLEVA